MINFFNKFHNKALFFLVSYYIFLFCPTLSLNSYEKNFIIEKNCPLYKFENNKLLKILDNQEKENFDSGSKFNAKEIKKINNSEYINLENKNEKKKVIGDFYINKNCGYFEINNKKNEIAKFDKKFLNIDEIEIIKKNFNKFDDEINDICSSFGSRPKKENLKTFFLKNQVILDDLYKKYNNSLLGEKLKQDEFLDKILDILFINNGFSHVFCGILKNNNKILGPHYAYRFEFLNNQNLIGIPEVSDRNKKILNIKQEISGGKFLINRSMNFIGSNYEIGLKIQNSFILNHNFIDLINIILEISRIDFNEYSSKKINDSLIQENKKNKKTNEISSCVLNYENKEIFYRIVFNFKNKSLITIYPLDKNDNKIKIESDLCKFK
jgi:hypothetical protein